jgi:hypothetical protein
MSEQTSLKIGGYYTSPEFSPGTVVRVDKIEHDLTTFTYVQAVFYPMLVGYSTGILSSYAGFVEVSELTKALL